MPLPTIQPLTGYPIIPQFPLPGDEFQNVLRAKIADVNIRVAHEIWEMVYDRGKDSPSVVADARQY